MSKSNYSSNSRIFARRGDPWISRREGESQFGRNLETEEPELDQFLRAKKAPERPKYVDPPAPGISDTFAKRKAEIVRKMNVEMRAVSHRTVELNEARISFRPCPSCRAAACIAKNACLRLK